jgi:hypothetical protein
VNNPFIAAAKILTFLLAMGLALWGIWLLLATAHLPDPFPTVIMIILVLVCLGLAYAYRGWFTGPP